MSVAQIRPDNQTFFHAQLPSGIELAVDPLPERNVAAIIFRVLAGVSDEPADLNGVGMIVERTLSKGTQVRDGRALADAFDLLGAQWGSASGRQSMMVRTLCLPEFALDVVDLVAEMLCQPVFPDEACRVAVQLALEQRRHLDDDPNDRAPRRGSGDARRRIMTAKTQSTSPTSGTGELLDATGQRRLEL
ncbi:MAG TPA: insulinase family protein, partial [Phycisphaerae bacterium]|nr:insulinase family protein [Phycisphaerae bacterium]